MKLTNEHYAILRHTLYRAAGKLYCGDSPEMKELVLWGLMRYVGGKYFVPEKYFTITLAGRVAFRDRPKSTEAKMKVY